MSELGYDGSKRAFRRPAKTFDQVLTVREIREKSRGDKGGKIEGLPTASSHRSSS